MSHNLRAGVAQASREETADCVAAALCRSGLWGFGVRDAGRCGYAAGPRMSDGTVHDGAA